MVKQLELLSPFLFFFPTSDEVGPRDTNRSGVWTLKIFPKARCRRRPHLRSSTSRQRNHQLVRWEVTFHVKVQHLQPPELCGLGLVSCKYRVLKYRNTEKESTILDRYSFVHACLHCLLIQQGLMNTTQCQALCWTQNIAVSPKQRSLPSGYLTF